MLSAPNAILARVHSKNTYSDMYIHVVYIHTNYSRKHYVAYEPLPQQSARNGLEVVGRGHCSSSLRLPLQNVGSCVQMHAYNTRALL